jgi:hypothetical protein
VIAVKLVWLVLFVIGFVCNSRLCPNCFTFWTLKRAINGLLNVWTLRAWQTVGVRRQASLCGTWQDFLKNCCSNTLSCYIALKLWAEADLSLRLVWLSTNLSVFFKFRRRWGLNSNYRSGRRWFKFIVPSIAFKILRRTEGGSMWEIKDPYIAPRLALKG